MLDQMANEIKLISGSSHPGLSSKVAHRYVQGSCENVVLHEALLTRWVGPGLIPQ